MSTPKFRIIGLEGNFVVSAESPSVMTTDTHGVFLAGANMTIKEDVVTLVGRPLFDITDEDDLELCNILNTGSSEHFLNYLKGETTKYSIQAMTAVRAYNFLKSRGYKLPE